MNPPRHDEIFGAIDDVEEVVLVASGDIAGAQTSRQNRWPHRSRQGGRCIPHHVAPADDEFTAFARTAVLAVGAEHASSTPHTGISMEPGRLGRSSRLKSHHRACFGQAVSFADAYAEDGLESLEKLDG